MAAQAAAQKKEENLCKSAKFEDAGTCKKKFSIEVAPETIRSELDAAVEELRKTAALPGFRPGRVPKELLRRKFAKEIESDVKSDLVERAFHEAIEEEDLRLMRHPRIDEKSVAFDAGTGLRFSGEVLLRPQFEVKEYHGMNLKRAKVAVDDGEIDRGILDLRKQRAQWVPVEGEGEGGRIEPTDLVIGRLNLAVEGLDPIVRDGFTILLEEGMVGEIPVEKLAESFQGKQAGSEVSLEAEIPATFTLEPYRGKRGKIAFSVEEVKRPQLPEMTDDFARLYHAGTVAELREGARKTILREKERWAEVDLENQIHEELAKKTPFDLPEEAILAEALTILRRYHLSLQARGFPQEVIQAKIREVQKRSQEEGERRLRSYLILEEIAAKEKIYASEQEVARYVAAVASNNGKPPDRMRSELERDGSMDDIRVQLRHGKVIEHIKSKATISEE